LSSAEVAKAAAGLSEPLSALFHSLLHREPSRRPGTAAELEEALRGRLAELRPYDAPAALVEVEQIMSDAGASLVEQEVAGAAKGQLRSPKQVATR
jgi:serine/threonine-protein kinase